jgi:hypothetical protein
MGRDCAQTRSACRTGRRPRRPRSRCATRWGATCSLPPARWNRENPRRSRAGSPPVPSHPRLSGEKFDRRLLRIQPWRALRATLIGPRLGQGRPRRGWLGCHPTRKPSKERPAPRGCHRGEAADGPMDGMGRDAEEIGAQAREMSGAGPIYPCVYRKPKPGHSGDGVRREWATF